MMNDKNFSNRQILLIKNLQKKIIFSVLCFIVAFQVGLSVYFESVLYSSNKTIQNYEYNIEKNNNDIGSIDAEIIALLRIDKDTIQFLEERGYHYISTIDLAPASKIVPNTNIENNGENSQQ